MLPQGVALWDARVIEVEFGMMLHSDFFHYVERANVCGHGDGDDFL